MATKEEKERRARANRRAQQDKALDILDSDEKAHSMDAFSLSGGSMKDRLERQRALNLARQKIIAEALRRGDRSWREDDKYKY